MAMIKLFAFFMTLAFVSLACAFQPFGEDEPDEPNLNLPSDELIQFHVPLYSTTLDPGESVPLTQMTYVGSQGDTYNVMIGGLPATKRIGDSFPWRGIIAPGVVARYNLRLTPTFVTDDLLVGGPVEVSILNPVPVELQTGINAGSTLVHFDKIPIEYTVPKGGRVPGTTLVYERLTDQGAELSGTSGFPYHAKGDSLIWTGRLRGNVNIRYSLRVSSLSEESMGLIGTAELWVTPK